MFKRTLCRVPLYPSVSALFLVLFFAFFLRPGAEGSDQHGLYVYFMSKRNGYYSLYRSDLHKTEELYTSKTILEKFPDMAKYQISYDVSPEGRYLAWGGLSERGMMDIFLLDIVDGEVRNLTNDDNVDSMPVFSRDGRWIAYLSHEPGGRHYDNITLTARDGSEKRLITRDFFRILSLEFFPGDEEMLFVKYLPFHSALAKVNLASGRVTDLTDLSYANRSPSVSPDGSTIVYASDRKGSFDIWIMRSDGSEKRVLCESPGTEYEPRFICGGKKVIFLSDFVPEKGIEKIGNSIYSIDSDGTHLRNLLPLQYLNNNFFCSGLFPVGNGEDVFFEGRYAGARDSTPSLYILEVPADSVRKIVKEKYPNTDLKVVSK